MRARGAFAHAAAWLFLLRGSPEAVARGMALGVFISVTPTLGIQVWLAAILATLLGANRPAAIAMVFVTNPFTAGPIFWLTYEIGLLFHAGPPPTAAAEALQIAVANIGTLHPRALVESAKALGTIGREIMVPTAVGGGIVGVALAAPTYVLTLRLVTRARERHEARLAKRRGLRRKRRRKRAKRG